MHPSSRAPPRLQRYGGTRVPLPNALSTDNPATQPGDRGDSPSPVAVPSRSQGRAGKLAARLLKNLRKPGDRARRAYRRRREPHGLILAYHRVAKPGVDPWQICVSPEHFARQLKALSEFADVVPLPEFGERLKAARNGRPVLAITFDDGYADNLHAALPVLEHFEMPATIFLSTGWIDRKAGFWWDRLADTVLEPATLPGSLEMRSLDFRWTAGSNRRRDREALHLGLWERLRNIEDDLREDFLERLAEWAKHTAPAEAVARPMTADEVGRLSASPLIEIGGHSLTHRAMSGLSLAAQMEEIEQSGRDCERLSGVRPRSFAYPFGDHDAETPGLTRQAGYARACTTHPNLVFRDTDPYRLPRVAVLDLDGPRFRRRLHREWLP
jgi:peptidoglycan/xylan/chitin deacetylase (PgdA/CDA1 family)